MTFNIKDRLIWSVFVIMAFGLFAACAPAVPPDTPEPIITDPPEITPPPPAITPIPTPEDGRLQRMVAKAQQDLAERLQISVDDLVLIEFRAVVWSDSSLGCPEPGEGYLPVLMDGYLIQFEAKGEVYQYHSGEDLEPFLCEDPQEPYDDRLVERDAELSKPTEEVSLEKKDPILTPDDPVSQRLVKYAKEDLSARLEISTESIELVLFEEVTWSDGSLGCPEPGMGYIQVLIEGHRIILRVGDQVYHYHSGEGDTPFLCEQPHEPYTDRPFEIVPDGIKPTEEASLGKQEPIFAPDDPVSQRLVNQAKEDLSTRLGIGSEAIELILFEEVTWSDGSLGCPEPGMGYIQVLIEGHRIILRVGDQVYHFHSGRGETPFLCEKPVKPLTPSIEG